MKSQMWEADIFSTNNLKAFIQVKSLHAKYAGTAYCQLDLSKLIFVKLKAQIQNIYLKMHLKIMSKKWQPVYSGLNVLTTWLVILFSELNS